VITVTKRLAELFILTGFTVMAVLLYRSTASFPEVTQGSTAMYIRFLAVSLGLLCLIELGLNMRKKRKAALAAGLKITDGPARFWSLLILMVLYAVGLEPLGFYLASALFLPLTMVVLGGRRPWSILLATAGVLLFVYLVFALILGVPLPEMTLF
jgi:putative tricarboxylic transport membrane protein